MKTLTPDIDRFINVNGGMLFGFPISGVPIVSAALQVLAGDSLINIAELPSNLSGNWAVVQGDGVLTINDYPGSNIMPNAVVLKAPSANYTNDELTDLTNATLHVVTPGDDISSANDVAVRLTVLGAVSGVLTPSGEELDPPVEPDPPAALIVASEPLANDIEFSVSSAADGETLQMRVDGVDYATDYNGDPMVLDTSVDQVFCLVAGVLVDDYDNSETVTYDPAIWVSLSDGEITDPVIQYLIDGVDADGVRALTRTVPDSDAGKTLSVRETFGGVTLLSNEVAIPVKSIANDEGAVFQYIASNAVYDGNDDMVSWPDSAPGADGTLDVNEAATGVSVPKRDTATGGVLLDGASGMRSGVNFRHHANLVQTPGTTVVFMYVIDVPANSPGDIQMPWAQTNSGAGNYFTGNRTMIGIRNLADFRLPAYVGRSIQIIDSQFHNPPNYQVTVPERVIIELHLSLEECRIYLNGSLEFTYDGTNQSASFPNTTDARNCIGGVMDAGQIGYPTTGVLHDIIATTSIEQVDNFRAELATKFGVTLQ